VKMSRAAAQRRSARMPAPRPQRGDITWAFRRLNQRLAKLLACMPLAAKRRMAGELAAAERSDGGACHAVVTFANGHNGRTSYARHGVRNARRLRSIGDDAAWRGGTARVWRRDAAAASARGCATFADRCVATRAPVCCLRCSLTATCTRSRRCCSYAERRLAK